jgi:hypothetical protein
MRRQLPELEHLDLFSDLDLILIPVNVEREHWYLAVIDFRTKTTRVYDSLYDYPYANTHTRLMAWLADAWDAQQHLSSSSFDPDEWTVKPPDANRPRQTNGYDCGVFVCLYAAYLSLGKSFNFGQGDTLGIRLWMVQLIYQIGALKYDEANEPAKTHVDKTLCWYQAAPWLVQSVALNKYRLIEHRARQAAKRRTRRAVNDAAAVRASQRARHDGLGSAPAAATDVSDAEEAGPRASAVDTFVTLDESDSD